MRSFNVATLNLAILYFSVEGIHMTNLSSVEIRNGKWLCCHPFLAPHIQLHLSLPESTAAWQLSAYRLVSCSTQTGQQMLFSEIPLGLFSHPSGGDCPRETTG